MRCSRGLQLLDTLHLAQDQCHISSSSIQGSTTPLGCSMHLLLVTQWAVVCLVEWRWWLGRGSSSKRSAAAASAGCCLG
jgi:hypothetical protein